MKDVELWHGDCLELMKVNRTKEGYCITDGAKYVCSWYENGINCGYYLSTRCENGISLLDFVLFDSYEEAQKVRDSQFAHCDVKKVVYNETLEIV